MKRTVLELGMVVLAGILAADGRAQPAQADGRPGGGPAERFAQADTNGNGVIDKDEFRGPPKMFEEMDTDGNGMVTPEEAKEAFERRMGGGNPEERFAQADTNGDGVIDKDEFRGPPELFAAMDADGSGTVTADEAAAAMAKRKTMRGGADPRFAQTDANGDGVVDAAEFDGPPEVFARLDGDGDGKITLNEAMAAIRSHLAERGGAGAGGERGGDQAEAGARFAQADKNGDGKVDVEEFRGPPELFERLDVNGDGAITRDEIRTAMQTRRGGGGAGARGGR